MDSQDVTTESAPAASDPKMTVVTADWLADQHFEPWTQDESSPQPPSNLRWNKLGENHLPIVRLGWTIMFKTKAELVTIIETNQHLSMRLVDDMRDTLEFFQTFIVLLEAAEVRMLTAAAVVAQRSPS